MSYHLKLIRMTTIKLKKKQKISNVGKDVDWGPHPPTTFLCRNYIGHLSFTVAKWLTELTHIAGGGVGPVWLSLRDDNPWSSDSIVFGCVVKQNFGMGEHRDLQQRWMMAKKQRKGGTRDKDLLCITMIQLSPHHLQTVHQAKTHSWLIHWSS